MEGKKIFALHNKRDFERFREEKGDFMRYGPFFSSQFM